MPTVKGENLIKKARQTVMIRLPAAHLTEDRGHTFRSKQAQQVGLELAS